MNFLEITKNIRYGNVEGYKMITKEELCVKHSIVHDLISWAKGARMNTRFFYTTPVCKYIYIRRDSVEEKEVAALAK